MTEELEPTLTQERSWMHSTAFWAVVGGFSSLLTALTALGAILVGLNQLKESRDLTLLNAAYSSWNELSQATLANPEFACVDTDAKFAKLMTMPDAKSPIGGTYQDRYAAYGTLLITTSEQILEMAPDDRYWRFRIAERMRCNAPAIRSLMADGTYDKRYSCHLRQVIAQVMKTAPPACRL